MLPITLLAADTGTRHCSVGIFRMEHTGAAQPAVTLSAEITLDQHRLHAECLLDVVDWILKNAGLRPEELTHLAVGIGPGSFTGLRVGAAAWKGLAFARRLPLFAVPSLDAMTRLNVMEQGIMLPLLDARMDEVFGAAYRFVSGKREKLTPDLVCPVNKLLEEEYAREQPLLVLGDGAERYRNVIATKAPHAVFAPPVNGHPRAAAIAIEAFERIQRGEASDAARVAPVYLRASQAEQARDARNAAVASVPGR